MRTRTPVCDQCEVLVINNVACHEQGCPNRNKPMRYRRERKPSRNERILESGYQAYAREEGHYDDGN